MIERTVEELAKALLKSIGGISQKKVEVVKPKKQKTRQAQKNMVKIYIKRSEFKKLR